MIFFQSFKTQQCCLCGDAQSLTGEHKIKASVLKKEFGAAEVYVGNEDDPSKKMKFAQSVRSKHLKFRTRICEACNTSLTQPADREFDLFNNIVHSALTSNENLYSVFDLPQYKVGGEAYLNVFRYFAKLLCCHLAELGAPRSRRLSNFAIGRSNRNCVWLAIQKDWKYSQLKKQLGEGPHAAHGGLIIYGDKSTGAAAVFHSTLTIGPVQYVFYFRLRWMEKLTLRMLFPQFHQWCQTKVKDAIMVPMSDVEKRKFGISNSTPRDQ